jgi:aldose 1-epimerase
MALITMQNERLRLTVDTNLGAGITDFSVLGPAKFQHPLMRRAAPEETNPSALSSFLLAPWCNRVGGARFTFEGKEVVLRASGSDGSAMHGDVRSRRFAILDRSPYSARLEFDSRRAENVNWPWPFVVQVRYEVGAASVSVDLNVTNAGASPMPAGCGHHPYFPRRLWDDRDVLELRAPVAGRYPLVKALPTGPAQADELTKRLATRQAFPAESLDDVFGGFGGEAELRWPASGVSLTMKCSANFGHLVLYSPFVDAKRPSPLSFVAVEPVTQVNNALNISGAGGGAGGGVGGGTVVLQPGETLRTRVDFHVAVG